MLTMDILKLLKADHDEVEKLFRQVEKEGDRRGEIIGKILSALEIHTRLEETLFYPELETAVETADLIRESYEEHKHVKELVAELRATAIDDPDCMPRLKVLREQVEHHVEEEESELFPAAKDVLDTDDRAMIGEEAEEMKRRATRGEREEAYPEGP